MSHSSSNTLGRYEIIREIARSNDIVYEAVDPSIGRRVALKELQMPANLVGSAKRERIERFYREAKAAGHLTHPNIVTIYEVGEEAGRHFIAMEFLEGQTLQDTIEIRGALPPQEAIDVALQVLDALGYAHTNGVIHRDIKPANIQMLPGGRVKLTDFGIARITAEPSITASGQIFGTPSYMSPEQIAGKDIDARSDLFSVGVVLYEALTAAKPFTGDSVVTITYNIMNLPSPRPAGVPEALADVVVKAMEKDPARRFQSAREFSDALKVALAQPSASAPPPPIFFPHGQSPYGGPPVGPPSAPSPFPGSSPPPAGSQAPGGGPGAFPSQTPAPNLPPPSFQRTYRPPRPLLTQTQKATLLTTFLAVVTGALLLLAIYGVVRAYDNYQMQQSDTQANSYIQKGNENMDSRRYDQAVEQYSKALQLDLTPATHDSVVRSIIAAYAMWANDMIDRGNPGYGLTLANKALEYNNDSGDALYVAGRAYYRTGQLAQALTYWERAAGDPSSSGGKAAIDSLQQYYWNQAASAQDSGDLQSAVKAWQRIVQIGPGTDLARRAQDQIDQAMLR
ncbi:MAG: protein kinase [Armatimonadetes bacterium]|nr:protein kinase [Armatimonadota bacterium]